jgi:DNA (cytosine-5)-methyltransferase 1
MNEATTTMVSANADGAPLTFLDLFSGCGGFSLGLEAAGLVCKAAIDFNDAAIETFKANHSAATLGLVRDLTKFSPKDLDDMLGGATRINVIVGGPPCQGFSKARMVDGSNHGGRLVYDARRDLYQEFLRFVKYYQPSVFVMENVPGIKSAAGGEFFTRLQVESRELGYRVIPYEVEAWRFGVPQKRVRQLIIGTRRELPLFIPDRYIRRTHTDPNDVDANGLQPFVSLGEAIGDLPEIYAGSEAYEREYDSELRRVHIKKYGTRYIYDVLHADKAKVLAAHSSRPHSLRDMRDFARLREGENSKQALARGVEMEFPYDRDNFKDRYTRQHRDQLCSTIVAHLKKDGLMFIHPTQTRSLTPREAARVQSFPDTFWLPEARTNSFAQIGNAVPPLVGKAMGSAIYEYLLNANVGDSVAPKLNVELPDSLDAAVKQVEFFVESTCLRPLTDLPKDEFLKAWWAVGFLHPNLHPDAALDNGKALSPGPKRGVSFVIEPVYVRSGWPVELIPIAVEARRRFDEGTFSEDEYYCSAAVVAGAVSHGMSE